MEVPILAFQFRFNFLCEKLDSQQHQYERDVLENWACEIYQRTSHDINYDHRYRRDKVKKRDYA
jgi:hypothetical protein